MAGNLTPWIVSRPGEELGRVQDPSGWMQPEGSYAMVLGTNTPGWTGRFAVGDVFDIYQTDSLPTAAKILRFSAHFRGPSRMPAIAVDEPAAGYALADGQTLQLAIDGGATQTITFSTAQFVAIGAARPWEVRDAINSALIGARAYLTGAGVGILSDAEGRRSRVQVVGGTAAALGFAELAWKFQLLIGGSLRAYRILDPGEEGDLSDMAGSLLNLGDPIEVRFRLELVSI